MIIHDVEQGSEEWFALRAGVPTASNANKLVTGTGKESKQIEEYSYQLAAEKFAGKELDRWEGNQYTERGNELEKEAIGAYELETGAWVEHVGICTTDDNLCGCSPDGLVGLDGLVEIKCPVAKNFVKVLLYCDKHKKIPVDYMPQVQFLLLVTGREWCDICFYHPHLPLVLLRQVPVPEFQKALLIQIKNCVALRDATLDDIGKWGLPNESK